MTSAGSDARAVTAYEDLRREVLSGETVSSGSWGLALVIQRGLPAWLDALGRREGNALGDRAQPRQIAPKPPVPLGAQMTMLLAGMILAGRREARA